MRLRTVATKGGLSDENRAAELLASVPEIEFGENKNTQERLVKIKDY